MRVLLLGTDNFSAVALNAISKSAHLPVAAFTHVKNKDYKRFKSVSEFLRVPFHVVDDINSKETEEIISLYSPDIIFSCHFDRILKPNIINLPKICAVNLHPSKLPSYRGMTPFQNVLKLGERETAISIHYIDENVDTGDIIAQKIIPLNDDMYLSDLQKIMIENYPEVISRALDFIACGRTDSVKQSSEGASYFGKISDRDREINLNGTVINGYRLIRAMSKPFAGAFTGKYTIWKATLCGRECLDEKREGRIFIGGGSPLYHL